MILRFATAGDIPALNRLLRQVLQVHHGGRPDIFRPDTKKYTDEELKALLTDPLTPIFMAETEDGVLGYAFCQLQETKNNLLLQDRKTLYIDDLCVEEGCRGTGIGKALLNHVRSYAKEQNCHSITLNVWALNESALRFYQKNGLLPLKYGMEQLL